MARPVPNWVLLRYRVGELPEGRMEEVRQRLATEPELSARLAAMDEEEAALLDRLPPRVVAAGSARRASVAEGRAWWRFAVPAVLLVVVAALALVALWTPGAPEVRAKGATPHLRVFCQVAGGVEELREGDSAAAGDVLQLHYSAHGRGWGVVFSVDGAGVVTVHLPPSGDQAAPLAPEGTVALPSSYQLDEAPGYERFFFVTSTEPFDLEPVLAAVDGPEARLEVADGLDVDSFLVRKPGATP